MPPNVVYHGLMVELPIIKALFFAEHVLGE